MNTKSKHKTNKKIKIKRKTKKQKGGRLRCSTIEKDKWVAMEHKDTDVYEYRQCEARFMNMLLPSIPCSDANTRDLFNILQDTGRIIAAFNTLDYDGQRKVLVNLDKAIQLRTQWTTSNAGHIAFLRIEQALYPLLEPLLKPKPPDLPDKTWDDIDAIDSDLAELRNYMNQLENGSIVLEGSTPEKVETELDNVRENIKRLEAQKLVLYPKPSIPEKPEAASLPVETGSEAAVPDVQVKLDTPKLDLKQKAALASISGAADTSALNTAIQTVTTEKNVFAERPNIVMHDIKSFRRLLQFKPRVKSSLSVQFLSDETMTTYFKTFADKLDIQQGIADMRKIERKSTALNRDERREHMSLQNSILLHMLGNALESYFSIRIYNTLKFTQLLQILYFFTETSPPFLLSNSNISEDVSVRLPPFYNGVYFVISQFSKHALSKNYYISVSSYYLEDYVYIFGLFEELFKNYDDETISKLKIMARHCIDNIHRKPNIYPGFIPLFDLPCFTLNESISIRQGPFFHEILNTIVEQLRMKSLKEQDKYEKLRLKYEKGVEVDLKAAVVETNLVNKTTITEYLNAFVDNIIPEIKELRDKKDKPLYKEKMLLIVKTFLLVFENVISCLLELYQFDKTTIPNFPIFASELELFIKLLRVTIMTQGKYTEQLNDIYFTYVKIYHFMYSFVYTDLVANKKFESENVKTFNATVEYIFEHDL